jgi:ketosteroid isomerase-like protein
MLSWLRALFLSITIFILSSPLVRAQNIPPMIGTEIKNPGIKVPNPMEQKGSQQQNSYGQQPATQAQEIEISTFLGALTSAYSNRNSDAVGSSYSSGIELTVFWNEKQFIGAEAFKEEMQEFFRDLDTFTLELIEPKNHIFGRFAWVTAKCRVKTYSSGVESALEGTITLILERRKSVWTILHEHRILLPSKSK